MFTTASVWATPITIAGNTVKQLLVPAGALNVELAADGVHKVFNEYGAWLATRGVASGGRPSRCLPADNSATAAV